MKTNMTTKEIKELALQILNRNGESGIKKSDFTVKQAKAVDQGIQLRLDEIERKIKEHERVYLYRIRLIHRKRMREH